MDTNDPLVRCGALLSVGVRGAAAGDPRLESDLDTCAAVGVGSIVLFDLDVPRFRAAKADGADDAEARRAAERNVQSPEQLRALCAYLRRRLGEGLVILVDQEGGDVARLRPERGFKACLPSATEFATWPPGRRQEAARRQAREIAGLGIDGNLAPVVDLGVQPDGPLVRKGRTFSSRSDVVLECARDVISAHRSEGVATCLKHFPGLGSAAIDTHLALPVLGEAFDVPSELAPYRTLLGSADSPPMVMVGHAVWTEVDAERPASASHAVVTGVLRGEMGFTGVIATDSLDMGGAKPEVGGSVEAAVASLRAGADLLMDAVNLGGPREGLPHPARLLASALAEAADSGSIEGGLGEVDRRAARVRSLRRRPP
jgi:beta-N-acetylhexosaminidase